uniref:Cell division cycle associated 5 n=1 Tax=Pelusios castaneus TaxID=367368 RepID=A0A8C8SUJ9_9SAUR
MADGGGQRRTRSASAAPAGSGTRRDAVSPPPRRRSERLKGSPTRHGSQRKALVEKKMMGSPLTAPVVKRSIVVKKIMPRKQQAGKENVSVASGEAKGFGSMDANPILASTALPSQASGSEAVTVEAPVLSPVSMNVCHSPAQEEASDLTMAKKVRRSYSRLDTSFHCHSSGHGASGMSTPLFGFERLLLPAVSPVGKVAPSSELARVELHAPARDMDTNIPGISFTKEKRKKRRIPQIDKSELDEWAAQMNAQFEEAEQFDLLVE